MSTPKAPDSAKLVISIFMKEKQIFDQIFDRLESIAGPCDIISKWFDFDYTDYYHGEMGSPLYRRLIAFKPLILQEKLASIKIATNYRSWISFVFQVCPCNGKRLFPQDLYR